MKFHDIDISQREELYVLEALRAGHICGRGPHTQAIEADLEKKLGARRVLMTTSCTHALEMAVRLGQIGCGDEVLLPSYTFPSTANAVLAVGARPVLIPTEERTLCISLDIVKRHKTEKTKAVIAVHYGGICHDIAALAAYCKREGLVLIEDAAQAYGSIYKNKPLGTYGDFACFSFHGTKNDVAGEGGAFVINTGDTSVVNQAERLLEKGTDKLAFMRGQASKYEWKSYGSSYVPSDILMALLRGQLETAEKRMEKRREVIGAYTQAFAEYEGDQVSFFKGFESLGEGCLSNGHLYYVIFRTPEKGRRFYKKMIACGIHLKQHFMPLHMSEMGRLIKYDQVALASEDSMFDRLYRLPLHSKLSQEDVKKIIKETQNALKSIL